MLFVEEIVLGNMRILAGHTDALVVLQQLSCSGRSADTHSALSEAKVQDLIHISVLLQNGIPANHADVGSTVLYVGGHIRSFCKKKPKLQFFIGKYQLSGILVLHLLTGDADGFQKLQCLIGKTPLAQGKRQISVFAHLLPPVAAVRTTGLPSPRILFACARHSWKVSSV